jgi:hypothetical protein
VKVTTNLIVGTVAVMVTIIALAGTAYQIQHPASFTVQPPKPLTVEQKASAHLLHADKKCVAAVTTHLEDVKKLFNQARGGAKPYAEEVLGWNGKLELAKGAFAQLEQAIFGEPNPPPIAFDGAGYNPFMPAPDPAKSHERYLMQEFNRKVLSPDDLKATINKALQAYIAELEAVENQALVLAADNDTLEKLNAEFKERFAKQIDALSRQAALMAGQQVATAGIQLGIDWIATKVAIAVAADLGISSALLGGGAASGVATFGVGIIVGIIVDQIVGALLKEFGHDPVEKVAAAVTGSLDNLERSLLVSLRDEIVRRQLEFPISDN